jgi:hypothetical protein
MYHQNYIDEPYYFIDHLPYDPYSYSQFYSYPPVSPTYSYTLAYDHPPQLNHNPHSPITPVSPSPSVQFSPPPSQPQQLDSTSSSTSTTTTDSPILVTPGKKPPLACLFCRGRKIACGPPPPGSTDKTCKYVPFYSPSFPS